MSESFTNLQPEPIGPMCATLTREQAAEYLNIPQGTLDVWRTRKKGPCYVRMGRNIRYRVTTLDAYLLANEQGGSAA
ncbi:helix-turn-helix domain-containing protein [Brevibacterium zhoupengii]|uniref:helix-turn-helix domain-containing protein n=1 Tax=Brevibacterium zhoupengii TaxID=2898795 RepID=UPI001F08EB3C|nr:helix-turn-helix domain-containing protein [Brevibacterium zhoupengii]